MPIAIAERRRERVTPADALWAIEIVKASTSLIPRTAADSWNPRSPSR